MPQFFEKGAEIYAYVHHDRLEGDGSALGFENNERLLKSYKSHRDVKRKLELGSGASEGAIFHFVS